MQRKLTITLTLFLLFVYALPLAAHGGDEGSGVQIALVNSNVPLISVSILLSLVTVGIAFMLTTQANYGWLLGIVGLNSLSAFIHIGVGMRGELLLLLNGLGYLGILMGLILPIRLFATQRKLFYWLLLGYTVVTFVGFFALHPQGVYGRTELLTKTVELLLILLIGIRIWRSLSSTESGQSVITS